jgi:hypothetical protein
MSTVQEHKKDRPVNRRRRKISITVDPDLLNSVDDFVRAHPEWDRSRVLDHALYLWHAHRQDRAMEAQFLAPGSATEVDEHVAWSRVRDAAASRLLSSD